MKKAIILLFLIIFSAIFSNAAAPPNPEIFVQTGHINTVEIVAVSPGGVRMVSLESGYPSHLKVWDVATAREIRTIELKSDIDKIVFIDEDRFMVYSSKSAEIYDLQGQKTEVINYPQIRYSRNPLISTDRLHLFADNYNPMSGQKKIYSMKDGAELSLLEIRQINKDNRPHDDTADLRYGYYGVFYKEQSVKGNTGYVIYDNSLKVVKKGFLNMPSLSTYKFRVSAGLQYLAYHKIYDHTDYIYVHDLETGGLIFSYAPRPLLKKGGDRLSDEYLDFDFAPDGRLRVEYSQWVDNPQHSIQMATTFKVEMVLVSPAKDGGYTEKRITLDNLAASMMSKSGRPYTATAGGQLLTGFSDGNVRMKDLNTGADIRNFGVKTLVFSNSSCVGGHLLNWAEEYSSDKYFRLRFNLWDMDDAGLKQLDVTTETGMSRKPRTIGDSYYPDNPISSDPERLYSRIPAEFLQENYRNGEYYGRLQGMFFLTRNTGDLYTKEGKYSAALLSKKNKIKLADMYTFSDGEWIIITPGGYYSASAGGDRYLNVRVGNNVYSIGNYREAFFRPDLVKIAVKGNSLEGYRTLANVGTPPAIRIENTPDKTITDSVSVTVRIIDAGGGIGDIRLYLNDTSIMADTARSVQVKAAASQKEIIKSYTIKLVNGENIIKAIAFDKENNVQSNPALQKISASYKTSRKPSLYALVIGINEYKNSKLALKYATADAKLFADVLQETAGRLFDKVSITRLISKETASKSSILKELDKYRNLNPDDVFAFYVASHGTVDDGEYFLITSNVGALSTEKLKTDAITQKELRERIANIPAAKKLIIIDTCNAGKMGEQLQIAMLTRGMSEDTAMKILSRAVGSTIISAATSVQEALEGYKDHGLFTYVLTEGMRGKADSSRSGYVKTSDLASYVEEKVPEIAESVFKRAQYPTKAVNGQDFLIGRIKQAK